MVAEVDVNEADIALLHVGDSVEVTVDAVAGRSFPGKLAEISGQADRARGTVLVKVALPADPALRPNMTAKARFQGSAPPTPQLLVPKEAVASGAVWLVQDGRVHKQPVTTKSAGAQLEVESGLKAGDRIVASNPPSMADGDRLPQ
jgi:HlyD family secretion protein